MSDGKRSGEQDGQSTVRGRFRGRMYGDGGDGSSGGFTFRDVLDFLSDPQAPVLPKLVFYAALFYILLPLDVLPGLRIPVVGWLDDLLVALLAWRLIKHDIARYRRY